MKRESLAALALLSTITAGCDNAWDGTWLWQIDPNTVAASGDCADDGGDDEFTTLGTEDVWVDIFAGGDDRYFVSIDGNQLVGTEDGGVMTATYLSGFESPDSSQKTQYTLSCSVDGDTMTGTLTSLEEQRSTGGYYGNDDYTCTTTANFTGHRIVSDPDEFVSAY